MPDHNVRGKRFRPEAEAFQFVKLFWSGIFQGKPLGMAEQRAQRLAQIGHRIPAQGEERLNVFLKFLLLKPHGHGCSGLFGQRDVTILL